MAQSKKLSGLLLFAWLRSGVAGAELCDFQDIVRRHAGIASKDLSFRLCNTRASRSDVDGTGFLRTIREL